MIAAPGHEKLVTHVFVKGDDYIDSDVVFGVKDSLVTDFQQRTGTVSLAGEQIDRPHRYLRYDFSLRNSQVRPAA
jgi:hydroxyquinol 1,2-dioxygenase